MNVTFDANVSISIFPWYLVNILSSRPRLGRRSLPLSRRKERLMVHTKSIVGSRHARSLLLTECILFVAAPPRRSLLSPPIVVMPQVGLAPYHVQTDCDLPGFLLAARRPSPTLLNLHHTHHSRRPQVIFSRSLSRNTP